MHSGMRRVSPTFCSARCSGADTACARWGRLQSIENLTDIIGAVGVSLSQIGVPGDGRPVLGSTRSIMISTLVPRTVVANRHCTSIDALCTLTCCQRLSSGVRGVESGRAGPYRRGHLARTDVEFGRARPYRWGHLARTDVEFGRTRPQAIPSGAPSSHRRGVWSRFGNSRAATARLYLEFARAIGKEASKRQPWSLLARQHSTCCHFGGLVRARARHTVCWRRKMRITCPPGRRVELSRAMLLLWPAVRDAGQFRDR